MMPLWRRARLADSRLAATVSFHQRGYAGQKVDADGSRRRKRCSARARSRLRPTAKLSPRRCCSMPARPAPKRCSFRSTLLPGEENRANNSVTRLVNVDVRQAAHPLCRRRAALGVQVHPARGRRRPHRAGRLHAAHHAKTRSTGRASTIPKELAEGFPTRAEDLFGYQAIIIGSVEASYFTPAQQDLIRRVRRSARRRAAAARRPLLARPTAAGARRILRTCCRSCCPTGKNTFHARSRPRSNSRRPAPTASSRGWSTIPRATPSAGRSFPI